MSSLTDLIPIQTRDNWLGFCTGAEYCIVLRQLGNDIELDDNWTVALYHPDTDTYSQAYSGDFETVKREYDRLKKTLLNMPAR